MESNDYVMVVDDEPFTRQVMKLLLERAGHHVACAADGQEALDYLRGHPPPFLILLDLNMPVLSGWEFRKRQQQDAALAVIPVVVVSGEPAPGGEAVRLGAAGFVPKPVAYDTLLDAVRRHQGRRA